MKQKLLKTMLLLCALVVGGASSVWADDVTLNLGSTTGWTLTKTGTSGTGGDIDMSKDGIQLTGTKGYYDSGNHLRVYSGGSLVITSNIGTITNMVITCTANKGSNNGPDKISTTTGSYSTTNNSKDGTWTGSASTISFSASAQCRISNIVVTYTPAVSKKNTTLTLSPTSLDLSYGGSTGSLTATVTPEGESALASPTVTWESNDESVATVSDGVVSPVGEGSCTITATYAGDEDYKGSSNTATVTVSDTRTAVVSAISSICSQKTLYIGGEIAFAPSVTLADGLSASDVTYSYVSADPTTIRINGNGTYTVLKTGTNINITVTATPIAAKLATHKPVSATFQHNGAYRYSKPIFTPTGVTEGNFEGSMTLAMDNDGTPTGPIYYTTDGTEPAVDKSNCTLYESSLTLTSTTTVKARVIDANGLYSTVTTATYTKIPANKDAISLGVDESLSFTDFSAAGSYWSSESKYLIASDGDKYKWTGTDVGNYSGKTLQIKNNTSAYITSVNVTSTNGFKMTLSYTGSVDVYVGSTKQTAADDGAFYFPTNTAVTLKRGTSSTPQVSNITFTGLKAPVATDVVITDPGTLATGDAGTFAYTAATEEDNTASWASATPGVMTITDASTGEYTAAGRGTAKITLTLTPDDATTYEAVFAERTITVTTPVVVTASDVDMTYGNAAKAIGASTSDGYAGTLSYVSGNTSIATVDASGNVTAVAAGSTTITISAAADAEHYYTAGEDVEIDVTVSAPEGVTTAKTTTPVTVVSRTLLSSSLPANWTGDGAIWSGSSSYGACTAAGTIGNSYDLKTESIDLTSGYSAASVTFEHTGNQTFSTSGTGRAEACKLFVKDGDTETQLTINTMFAGNNWNYVTNTTDLTAYIGKTIQLIFRYTPSSGNQGKWEVKNFSVSATPSPTESVKLNASGYATFCSIYPLDFTDYATADYSAWQITDVNTTNGEITFSQITGSVKGGTGLLIKGTANETISLTSSDSDTELSGNKLVGTLAPTYVTTTVGDNTLFGLSGESFKKINSGTIPANKAYLPIFTSSLPSGSIKSFTFLFEDATGIRTVEEVSAAEAEAIFNLAGQRIQQPQKGINIINGRKVVVK